MKCNHYWRESYRSFKNNKHVSTTYICNTCQDFKVEQGSIKETDGKRADDRDRRLDLAVRQGKMQGKPLSKLRSYMKYGKWHYKYI